MAKTNQVILKMPVDIAFVVAATCQKAVRELHPRKVFESVEIVLRETVEEIREQLNDRDEPELGAYLDGGWGAVLSMEEWATEVSDLTTSLNTESFTPTKAPVSSEEWIVLLAVALDYALRMVPREEGISQEDVRSAVARLAALEAVAQPTEVVQARTYGLIKALREALCVE